MISKEEEAAVNRMLTHRMLPVLLILVLWGIAMNCEGYHETKMSWGFETWKCPNKACGFDNYTAIEYCGLCGTKRPMKGRLSCAGEYAGDIPVSEYSEHFDVVYFDGHAWFPVQLIHHPKCDCLKEEVLGGK
jgi:hypothetical protein